MSGVNFDQVLLHDSQQKIKKNIGLSVLVYLKYTPQSLPTGDFKSSTKCEHCMYIQICMLLV